MDQGQTIERIELVGENIKLVSDCDQTLVRRPLARRERTLLPEELDLAPSHKHTPAPILVGSKSDAAQRATDAIHTSFPCAGTNAFSPSWFGPQ
jgi:hypothetical protein